MKKCPYEENKICTKDCKYALTCIQRSRRGKGAGRMIECMRTEATRKTVTEQRWIPVKYHELTEEERKECLFSADIKYMIDCELPDDEQEIIVTDGRHVWVDTCIVNDGYALDSGHDWIEDVIAWMPLPEPYRESEG